ncbi:hypothetical protein RhiirA5_17582 [Rhizophagus irregularis]|uniref:Uncharacterized protein n=1 Tax=Rhizophagus irregularis TaxID=588596 RepID=A0A2N0P9S4_9GLOM|nr:hypothetical protein RhiirA5_17582 [Rhizophagus irregularis]
MYNLFGDFLASSGMDHTIKVCSLCTPVMKYAIFFNSKTFVVFSCCSLDGTQWRCTILYCQQAKYTATLWIV